MPAGLSDLLYVVFHIASIMAALAAGVLWLRSASIRVPDIAPYLLLQAGAAEQPLSMREIEENLEQHRQAMARQSRYNRAAAQAASAAAAAQAATFALNLLAVFARAAG
ncbi:hypothetical protein ACFFJB_05620 [Camelimonas abortus]|uniref:Uncharacterized protein n=1 Tax=Camelimonas abortus TaxID=1017184 RepID=A0ABV7LBY7_9HYPH